MGDPADRVEASPCPPSAPADPAVAGEGQGRFGEGDATRLPVARLRQGGERLTLAGIALFCVLVMVAAALLRPDPRGFGTHEQLGLLPCGFKRMTGLPCPTCGMTTAFAWTVRGEFGAAWQTQPFGMALALLTPLVGGVAAWAALTYRSLSDRLGPRFWFWTLWAGTGGLVAAWISRLLHP